MSRITCKVFDDSGPPGVKAPELPVGKSPREAKKFRPHVLVVDDEPLIRWSVAESLVDCGYVVEQAPDAASALRIVTTSALPFNTIVLDLRLPDMCDLSLLATLRQLLPGTHVILMTSAVTAELTGRAHALGADVIAKPFELHELTRLVRARPSRIA